MDAIEKNGVPPTEVGTVLTASEKIPLQKIFADVDDDEGEGLLTPIFGWVAREINFYLSLNRHGRMLQDHLEERPQWALASGSRQDRSARREPALFISCRTSKIVNWNALCESEAQKQVMILRQSRRCRRCRKRDPTCTARQKVH
jgi:hypothetical protein